MKILITGAKVLVYCFSNFFGKWCKPNIIYSLKNSRGERSIPDMSDEFTKKRNKR